MSIVCAKSFNGVYEFFESTKPDLNTDDNFFSIYLKTRITYTRRANVM